MTLDASKLSPTGLALAMIEHAAINKKEVTLSAENCDSLVGEFKRLRFIENHAAKAVELSNTDKLGYLWADKLAEMLKAAPRPSNYK